MSMLASSPAVGGAWEQVSPLRGIVRALASGTAALALAAVFSVAMPQIARADFEVSAQPGPGPEPMNQVDPALVAPPEASGAHAVPAASSRAVLLELYTAQGCASCPPADEMMLQLAARDDVIALALHVDYWDYIGWTDTFASAAYTDRQQRYARRYGHSTIYTPQVVINGTEIMEGFRVMQVMDSIADQSRRTPEVEIALTRDGDSLTIALAPVAEGGQPVAMASRRSATASIALNSVVGTLSMDSAAESAPPVVAQVGTGPYSVQLVRYRDMDEVEILGGENAGRTAQYANIVTAWDVVGNWDMLSPLTLSVAVPGPDPVVVVVQESGLGEIVGAARLR